MGPQVILMMLVEDVGDDEIMLTSLILRWWSDDTVDQAELSVKFWRGVDAQPRNKWVEVSLSLLIVPNIHV